LLCEFPFQPELLVKKMRRKAKRKSRHSYVPVTQVDARTYGNIVAVFNSGMLSAIAYIEELKNSIRERATQGQPFPRTSSKLQPMIPPNLFIDDKIPVCANYFP
jgi:hypothetical protein